MQKILIKAPMLSRSGYGEQSRFALRAIRSREDLFDVYIMNIPWGHTGMISQDNEERRFIDQSILKASMFSQQGGQYDVSLQITIPPEFEKIAPINIGYTAGIETTKVAPGWLEKSNETVDRIITISEHSKTVMEDTVYDILDQQTTPPRKVGQLKLENTPVEVVNYPIRHIEADPRGLEIPFVTTQNFLVLSQWGPRKNLDNTMQWFIEEFRNESDVGLVLKTNSANDSMWDRDLTSKRLEALLKTCGDYSCKIYLVHGALSEEQITWLYQHPTMKALINIAHGEGFGLPLFEAAYNDLPLIAVPWSGHMDFICKPNKKGRLKPAIIKVDYSLQPIQDESVWDGVIQKDSMWAYAKENSYRKALRDALTKEKHYRNQAKSLKKYILANFQKEEKYAEFVEAVCGNKPAAHATLEDIPKISIITSVYDGDDHIEGFLQSITNQTIFKEKCELVLIDADSPGNENLIIGEYLVKYPNNIVYKKLDKDPGIYGTWNEALELATGEFITNANLDDRKASNSLERHALALAAAPDLSLVYADSFITNKPNETYEKNSSEGRRYNFEQFSKESMLRGNQPHNNPMWRKSLHDKYGLFNDKYRSAGDWEFFLRCAFEGEEYKKLDECLGLYYFNPKGISTNIENFEWKQKEEKEIFKKYFEKLREEKESLPDDNLVL